MLYIGVDLGTSACKFLLVDDKGRVLNTVSKTYPISFPHPGWSEQAPEDWWAACLEGIPLLLQGYDAAQVAAVGAGGQMHGLVALDAQDAVIRPAILWNDGRTAQETAYLNGSVGRSVLSERTANIAFAGFTAPKLLWMQKNEPELFRRIAKIMLPKDYLVYRMTGVHATDFSDASGTLLLDVKNKRWHPDMLALCGINESQMPALYPSYAPVGTLLPEAARALGLPQGTVVCAGAGDNAAAAGGAGTVGGGGGEISPGAAGTVFISSAAFQADSHNALHSFVHADGGWHLMGCMLSAASCNQWWMEKILETTDHSSEQEKIECGRLGCNDVFFLPYLMGERSPINDTSARGMFIGMSMSTTRACMTQAVLEGVAFAIRDSFEVARTLGLSIPRSTLCGGGAKSALWRKILANVLNIPLDTTQTQEGPGYGAALLAMVACGRFSNVQQAAQTLVRVKATVLPQPGLAEKYEQRYAQFRQIYPACRALFPKLQA